MSLPITPLRRHYDALGTLEELEETTLAELHADRVRPMVRRLRKSVAMLEALPFVDEEFYPGGTRKSEPQDRSKTALFARRLRGGRPQTVENCDDLGFRYVDRELSPMRTKSGERVPRRSLDLLLENVHDCAPIFAELKIGSDRLPYFALVQALMLSVELVVPGQGMRLREHLSRLTGRNARPALADIYLIQFKAPAGGRYRARSLVATERIAEQLVRDEVFARYLRRIAYLDAFERAGKLVFRKRFAFGPGA